MYVLINRSWGGFRFSDEFCEKYDIPRCIDTESRADVNIIKNVCEFGFDKSSSEFSKIRVAKIPDNTTDFDIYDYDGMEKVIYVVDGKLNYTNITVKNESEVVI